MAQALIWREQKWIVTEKLIRNKGTIKLVKLEFIEFVRNV